jgi:hypothetical protein
MSRCAPYFKRFIDSHLHFNKSKSISVFRQTALENPSGQAPVLHPLLVALAIVLKCDEDFSLVTENHPKIKIHKYYTATAVFPDLSPFIPPREDRWWEDLGASLSYYSFHFLITQ